MSAEPVIERLRRTAFKYPWWGNGPVGSQHRLVTTAILEPRRMTSLALTFDRGHHNSGWWANHEYDTCLHLSITHPTDRIVHRLVDGQFTATRLLESPSDAEVWEWATAFFGEHVAKCWVEPPASTLDPYRLPNVAHVRLFYVRSEDRAWVPIQPTGEVYHLRPIESSPAKILEGRLGGDVR